MLSTAFGVSNCNKKQRQLKLALKAALASALIASAGCSLPAMAQTSQYNDPIHGTYTPSDHADGGFSNPVPDGTPEVTTGGYGDIDGPEHAAFPLDRAPFNTYTSLEVTLTADGLYNPSMNNMTTGLTLRQAIGIANNTGTPVVITVNQSDPVLDGANGPIVIDNPNAVIVFKSHNFRLKEQTGTGWPVGTNALINVNAGQVLFYATANSPAYAQFPIEITGTGKVTVYDTHQALYYAGKVPWINILNISDNGEFRGNRGVQVNRSVPDSDVVLNDEAYFELGQKNTVFSNLVANDSSVVISNGGNTFYSYGPQDGSANTFNKNVTFNDTSMGVFGYLSTIKGNLSVNDAARLRIIGHTTVEGNVTFSANSTLIATLGVPIVGASQNPLNTNPNQPTGPLDPETTALLQVDGTVTVDDGARMILDRVTGSLATGTRYVIIKTDTATPINGDAINGNEAFDIENALTPISFSGLLYDALTGEYYVIIEGIDIDAYDVSGGNKAQRNFFRYLGNITAPDAPALPGGADSALSYVINNFEDLGPDVANSFLGDTYGAHDSQTYQNQRNFINRVASRIAQQRNADAGVENFSINGSSLNDVHGQLYSLRHALTPSKLGVNGALGAAGAGATSNGVWFDVYGDRIKTEADNNLGSPEWDGSTRGFLAGYTQGNERFSWGITAGKQESDLDFNDRSASGELDGWNAGLYGTWKSEKSYLTGILGYSRFDNEARRRDAIGTNRSDFKSRGLSAYGEYGMHLSRTAKKDLTPYASILWARTKRGAINESGTGAGLDIDASSNSIFTTQLGVRYNYRFLGEGDQLKGGLQLGAAWVHQFGDTDFPLTARFNGTGSSFTSYGTPLSGDALQLELGGYGRISGNLIGFAGYRGLFGKNEKQHSINAGVGYQF